MNKSRSLQRLLGAVSLVFVLTLLAGCPWPFDHSNDDVQPPTPKATIIVNKLPREIAFTDQAYASDVSAHSNLGAVQYTVAPVSANAQAASQLNVNAEGRIAWAQVPAIAGVYEYSLTTIDKATSASLATSFTIEVVATSLLLDAATTQTGGTVSDKTGTYRMVVPPNSVADGAISRLEISEFVRATGESGIRYSATGFKKGTIIKIVSPPAVSFPNPPKAGSKALGRNREYAALPQDSELEVTYGWRIETVSYGIDPPDLYSPISPPQAVAKDEKLVGEFGFSFVATRTDISKLLKLKDAEGTGSESPIAVLIHGFTPLCTFGGGDGTWGMDGYDALRRNFRVYEFTWRTCTPFEFVAADFAEVIKRISSKNGGKKVTVIAHSFGGIVVSGAILRAFSKEYAVDFSPTNFISRVFFFDSPVSGIARSDPQDLLRKAGFPVGQDPRDYAIRNCRQTSCHQAGAFVGEDNERIEQLLALYFAGIKSFQGSYIKNLWTRWESVSDFPAGFINVFFSRRARSSSDQVPINADGLIHNDATALIPGHYIALETAEYKGSIPDLQEVFTVTGSTLRDKLGTRIIPVGDNQINVFRINGPIWGWIDSSGAHSSIPEFVNYFFTDGFWSHSSVVLDNDETRQNLVAGLKCYSAVVAVESGCGSWAGPSEYADMSPPYQKHIFLWFVGDAARLAKLDAPVTLPGVLTLNFTAKTIGGAGAAVGNAQLDVRLVNRITGEKVVEWTALSNAGGEIVTSIASNTKLAASDLRAEIAIGKVGYRAFTETIEPLSSSLTNKVNGDRPVVLLTLDEIRAKKDLDVVFLTDLSGSYSDDLATFKTNANAILTAIRDGGARVRVGVASFIDYPSSGGLATDYSYRLHNGLAFDTATSNASIQAMTLGDGGDLPESQLEALFRLSASSGVGWAADTDKVVIMATDANFHNSENELLYMGAGYTATVSALKSRGIRVYVLVPGGAVLADAIRIAADTGGRVISAGSGSANIVCNIQEISGISPVACTATALTDLGGRAFSRAIGAGGRTNQPSQ